MKQHAARGSTAKHAGTHKSSGTKKHAPTKPPAGAKSGAKAKVHTKATHAAHAKARGLGEVAWCSAEALRASLRLAGGSASDADVWALHVAAGGSRDRGVPILAVLRAASAHGLGGVRLLGFDLVGDLQKGSRRGFGLLQRDDPASEVVEHLDGGAVLGAGAPHLTEGGHVDRQILAAEQVGDTLDFDHGLILGLELPGAHAVAVGGDGCWLSWGGHYDPAEFPAAAVEEAWAVTWQ